MFTLSYYLSPLNNLNNSYNVTKLFLQLKVKEDLDYKPTELKSTIIDMAYSLIDAGFVKKTAAYQKAKDK